MFEWNCATLFSWEKYSSEASVTIYTIYAYPLHELVSARSLRISLAHSRIGPSDPEWSVGTRQVNGGLECIRPLKKRSFDFWRCTRFSHYLVHLMPIGIILSEINQYLDLPHRLWSFRVLVHTLISAGMGDYILGWPCSYVQVFENARSHLPIWCIF